jgi:outer membrane protein assembly factor BamA
MDHKLETWFAASGLITAGRNIVQSCSPTAKRLGKLASVAAVFVLTLALWIRFPARSDAQQTSQLSYEGQNVAFVDLVARPNTKLDYLLPLVQQKAGEPYSQAKIQNSIRSLEQEGHFPRVTVDVTPEIAGLRVTLILEPAYYIGMIYFPGALKAFSYTNLLQVVNYPPQGPYDESRVAEGRGALLRYFAHSGFFLAHVQVETQTYMVIKDNNNNINISQ